MSEKYEQTPEAIWIGTGLYRLYTAPLGHWVQAQDPPVSFDLRIPTCQRGYIGRWEVKDKKLYLLDVFAWRDGERVTVEDLFDGQKPVFAEWYSGALLIEPGAEEIHDGVDPSQRTIWIKDGTVFGEEKGFKFPHAKTEARGHRS